MKDLEQLKATYDAAILKTLDVWRVN
jgi:hypothetical protein